MSNRMQSHGASPAPAGGKKRRLKVLTYKDRYPTSFMSARVSQHDVQPTFFMPFNKLVPNWDGFTVTASGQRTDLVHAFNRIPFNAKRYICSFESSLPRAYGFPQHSLLRDAMQARILSKRCRRIIAMSHAAKGTFLSQHRNSPHLERLRSKLMVRHPNIHLGDADDRFPGGNADHLTVTFVGAHFGRKGGGALVRAAELALERGIPVTFNIISSLQVGTSNWLDPTSRGFFEPYLSKLTLPNIRHHPGLPNAEARNIMRNSHFTLLPTLGDTFGYSMIESMAEHTPVIATRVNAVPEVVAHEHNGYLLDLPTDHLGVWVAPGYNERHTPEYAEHFRQANENIAHQLTDLLASLVGKEDILRRLRKNAYTTASYMFSATSQSLLWDALYERVASEDIKTEPVLDSVLDVSSPSSPLALLQDKFV